MDVWLRKREGIGKDFALAVAGQNGQHEERKKERKYRQHDAPRPLSNLIETGSAAQSCSYFFWQKASARLFLYLLVSSLLSLVQRVFPAQRARYAVPSLSNQFMALFSTVATPSDSRAEVIYNDLPRLFVC